MHRCKASFERARLYFEQGLFYAQEIGAMIAKQDGTDSQEIKKRADRYENLVRDFSVDIDLIKENGDRFNRVVTRFIETDIGKKNLEEFDLVSEWVRWDLLPQAEKKLAQFQACRLSLSQ